MFSSNILHDYNIRQRELYQNPKSAVILTSPEIKMWRLERESSFGEMESQPDFI